MTKHTLVVLTNANEGADDAFNDWYTNTHIGDILALEGFTAAQRFKLSETQLAEGDLHLLVAIGPAFNIPFCAAGYPALNVPAGQRPSGEPVGLTFVGRFGDEALLIRAAFGFEQSTQYRVEPRLDLAGSRNR